jgi:DNA-binding transcriptional MerR regulator
MPYKEKEINKLYYSIGEVSKLLNVNPSLLRFWEKYFGLVNPKKNRKGNRLFLQEEIDILKKIHHLVKDQGYTLAGAKELMIYNQDPKNEKTKALHTLLEIRSFLIQLRDR